MSTVVGAHPSVTSGQVDPAAGGNWRNHPLLASITFTAPLIPSFAATITVVLFLLGRSSSHALVYGAGATLLMWCLMVILARNVVSADHANTNVYYQLRERHDGLKVHLTTLKARHTGETAYEEAIAHNATVVAALDQKADQRRPQAGLQWVTATGYIALWNRIHRAEEALIQIEPREAVIGRACYDRGRLRGSTIPDRDDLLLQLEDARRALEHVGKPTAAGGQAQGSSGVLSEPDARATLRSISHVVNTFRDDRWEGLVRARNQLNDVGLFTGIVAFVFLSIMLVTAKVTPANILAATVFYLVGTITGLFSRLMADSSRQVAIEDYGLNFARLIHTPLFSGLAAIGGVVLLALLPISIAGEAPMVSGAAIFDLGQNWFGLVTAAVFGLTPRLLIDGLQGRAEQYKKDLIKSETTEKE